MQPQQTPHTIDQRLRRLNANTEKALLLLVMFASDWATGVSVNAACHALNCSPEEIQGTFDTLHQAEFIRPGCHGYIADKRLTALAVGVTMRKRGVH